MTLENLNKLTDEEKKRALTNCCGSSLWVDEMMKHFPFGSEELFQEAERIWFDNCREKDWLEAFTHHPKIGDLKSLEEKFASTKAWAGAEQASVQKADRSTLLHLAKDNEEYQKKFGFIFIVCATGKPAEEMLVMLKERLQNTIEDEIKIAMKEQHKITQLRLQKLLS